MDSGIVTALALVVSRSARCGRLVGRLQHYSVLYVLSTPQITGACGRAIAAWVASGGILVSTGGGGLLDGAPASPLMPDLHRSPRSRWTAELSRYFVPEPDSKASLSSSPNLIYA